MSAHTPGPWTIEDGEEGVAQHGGYFIVSGDLGDQHYRVICSRPNWPNRVDESLANARLIAAAPELLEALQAVMAGQIGGNPDMDAERFKMARAAIVKASGSTPRERP